MILDELRNRWASISDNRDACIPLALLHGIAERVAEAGGVCESDFFVRHLASIDNNSADPKHIENEARTLQLPVCNPDEDVKSLDAYFGIVGEVSGTDARVILLDAEDIAILENKIVPCDWLPSKYCEEGAGIAWIERHYPSGPRGRFEPASTLE